MKLQIPLRDAITQWGNIAGLVVGLMKPDYDLISRSLHDVVAEPIRSALIPGFAEMKAAAIAAGALGCGISGSGPTIFALSKTKEIAQNVGDRIRNEFERFELNTDVYVSAVNQQGAQIIQ